MPTYPGGPKKLEEFIKTNLNYPEKLLKDLKGTTGILAGLGFLSLPLLFAMTTEFFRKTKFTQQGIQRILYIQYALQYSNSSCFW